MSARNRRLPRHRAWPLTTTDVEEGLGPCLTHVRDLRFLTGQVTGSDTIVLSASWTAPLSRKYGAGVHPDVVGVSVGVHPVDATARAAARALLREQALPQLRTWVERAITADETWRLTPHQHCWHLTDGHLAHRDEA
ncbi:hypothetical protein ACWGH3_17440 [Streptomyces sp. NPDC054884]|uniref:hypothetical protein n=1 Tax=Streptomyces sp. ME08-AFT2 TaxID=3028683 RepID=UPI0029A65394|nr:hypothetical protein [Streptomyces sp. ME08-AFT2]MDX3309659.1 hypothetical protein [Streptomyces sp. ME08-AFT2]